MVVNSTIISTLVNREFVVLVVISVVVSVGVFAMNSVVFVVISVVLSVDDHWRSHFTERLSEIKLQIKT